MPGDVVDVATLPHNLPSFDLAVLEKMLFMHGENDDKGHSQAKLKCVALKHFHW